MGAAGRPAEAVLDGLPEVAQQVHADQSAIIGRDGRAFLIVGSGIVVGHGGRDGELIVDGDAKMHVVDGVAGKMHGARPFGKIVRLAIDKRSEEQKTELQSLMRISYDV